MRTTFVTYLGSENFLPGVLTLRQSLAEHNSREGLEVLLSCKPGRSVSQRLNDSGCKVRPVSPIENPHSFPDDIRGFRFTYGKLNIFDLVEYEKVVYLDADMLIVENIDSLFEKPHMSAVIAGGFLPENAQWSNFNSGLMVVVPGHDTFARITAAVGHLPSADKSDQGFLNSFFDSWYAHGHLHLDHKFNVPVDYLDKFADPVAVLHYWGATKPWDLDPWQIRKIPAPKHKQAVLLWWDCYHRYRLNL
ncbi:MAG TPA: glycosyltransferase [Puia sp.]|nr:glycosyltransferase [Puia sp.]